MRIRLPFCVPFEIVSHRPGQPVNRDDPSNGIAPAARSYLPIKLRRTGRPAWADPHLNRTGGNTATQIAIGANPAGTTAIAAQYTEEASEEQVLAGNLAELAAWVDNGPPIEREEREKVAQLYSNCWNNPHNGKLNISEKNRITSLPPIPPTVTEFTVWTCASIATLPVLNGHPQLKYLGLIACGNLTQLPDSSHCKKLETYVAQDCVGVVDPPELIGCRQLEELNFSGCTNLRSMPATSDYPQLKELNITDCEQLAGAVDLSANPQLKNLSMSGCSHVNALNLTGCTQLKLISLRNCTALTTIPPVGHLQQLDYLNMTNTPLTSVPEDFLSLPPDCDIQLDASRLSEAVRNRLLHVMNEPDYVGPRIEYSMGQPLNRIPAGPLDEEVAAWRAEAPQHLQQALTGFDWGALSTAESGNAFAQFLARMRETNDYRHASPALRAATQHRVAMLLKQMQTDPALRENCFNLATDAIDTCGDRVALRFLDMENCAVTSQAKAALFAGKYDGNPQALVDVCKGQHRLAIIAKEADDKTTAMNYVDAIEVHLGYLTRLAEPYQLPVRISPMLYPAWSHVSAEDIVAVRKKCSNDGLSPTECAGNDQAYQHALAASDLMRTQLERWDAAQMTAANAMKNQLIEQAADTLYEQLDALDPTAANFREQNRHLYSAFNALETDIKVRTTLPVLHAFLQAHHLDSGLGNAPAPAGALA